MCFFFKRSNKLFLFSTEKRGPYCLSPCKSDSNSPNKSFPVFGYEIVDININQLNPTHIHKLRQLGNHKLKKQTLTADHKRVTRSRPISTL